MRMDIFTDQEMSKTKSLQFHLYTFLFIFTTSKPNSRDKKI